ncbi:MAG: translation initiation factor IF-2 [Elusimicrobia bacterium]|nr:translation initiation factor IF-2 [Elusimicrobiota bacterium]
MKKAASKKFIKSKAKISDSTEAAEDQDASVQTQESAVPVKEEPSEAAKKSVLKKTVSKKAKSPLNSVVKVKRPKTAKKPVKKTKGRSVASKHKEETAAPAEPVETAVQPETADAASAAAVESPSPAASDGAVETKDSGRAAVADAPEIESEIKDKGKPARAPGPDSVPEALRSGAARAPGPDSVPEARRVPPELQSSLISDQGLRSGAARAPGPDSVPEALLSGAAEAPGAAALDAAPAASVPEKTAVTPAALTPPLPLKKKIILTPQITVKELAGLLGIGVSDIIKRLMGFGVWATINQRIESETAGLIAGELGFEVEVPKVFEEEQPLIQETSAGGRQNLAPRAPIVTIMGHVDHGKTTLLDAIRHTRVAEQEAGGITQHIGAYRVKTSRGDIVFLDTPGHEAFTAMRARGAKVTDIALLVVAADDRIMPQTIEAIDHAKAGGVKIIIAINKIDKPEANIIRLKQELSGLGLVAEDWGGKTVMVEVSAKKRLNLDKLLEMILLEAEMLELKANPSRPAVGAVLEARKDPKKGNVASILVLDGTLRVGDPFICGVTWGKIKALVDDQNRKTNEAKPATPVLIMGFEETPQAGDRLFAIKDERQARQTAERRRLEFERIHGKKTEKHLALEDLHEKIKKGLVKEFRIVLKADVQGSLEAVIGELSRLRHEEVVTKVLHGGLGDVNLSDVLLAAASDAVILDFNVATDPRASEEAGREGVEIQHYSVIYELIADARAALEGLLTPVIKENILGIAEVRAVFNVSGVGPVAGCFVSKGKISRGSQARVWRAEQRLLDGKITGLKRIKDDVTEVAQGYECGAAVSGYKEPKKGDRIECFEQIKKLKKLDKK